MKRLILFLIIISNFSYAQDLMIYKSGDEKEVKILKISSSEITFKKFSNINGPEYTIDLSEIFMIKYKNGDKDIFNDVKKSQQSKEIKLPLGTPIQLYLKESISSKYLQSGQSIRLAVKNSITTKEGKVIVNANTPVIGTITDVKAASGAGQKGRLNFNISSVLAANGDRIPVYYNMNAKGKDKGTGTIVIGALLFWPALFFKGGQAKFDAGTLINVETTQDFYIDDSELDERKIAEQSENIIINNTVRDVNQNTNPCGNKPVAPAKFNNPQYKQTKAYKSYRKELNIWKGCINK